MKNIFLWQEHADKITCPSCQSDCQLGPSGVAGLLPDYGVSSADTALDLAGCTGCKSRESSAVARYRENSAVARYRESSAVARYRESSAVARQ